MSDDWQKVAAPGDDFEPVGLAERPAPTAGDAIPEAFMDRVRAGQAISRVLSAAGKSAVEGAGTGTPTGFEDETLNHLIDLGVFHDPAKGRPGPLQMANEAVLLPTAQVWQAITRAVSGGIHGAGGAVGQIVEEFGGSQGTANRAKNEVINAGNWAMIEGGMGRFSRPQVEGGAVAERAVGGLPHPEDFANAAKVLGSSAETPVSAGFVRLYRGETDLPSQSRSLPDWLAQDERVQKSLAASGRWFVKDRETAEYYNRTFGDKSGRISYVDVPADKAETYLSANNPEAKQFSAAGRENEEYFLPKDIADQRTKITSTEANLQRMWNEDGIHPAEAVHDAQTDAFLKHDISAEQPEIKLDPETEQVLTETGGKPGSLSAAVTEPGDIPLDVQPPSPPGRLVAAVQQAIEKLFDIGRDIQMKLAPMARGTMESIATVKDYMNAMRRNSWDLSRIVSDIEKRFTPEQRTRMWNAMEEESLSLRLGEPESARQHQGLATLTAEERAYVIELDRRQQLAWLRARDLGMVEGEGIPMHAPRMIINIENAADREGAMSLDALGYDLRTRTPGMRQRKYMEVEETEAAAKAKYGDQAVVARDIRSVALATKQLEDAIAGRTLVENIKDVGKRTGEDVIAEGFQPDKTWFTVDHPAFKAWRPKFQEVDGRVEVVKDAEGKPVFEEVPIYVRGDFEGPLRAAMWGKTGDAYSAMMALKGKTMSLIMNSPMIHNLVEFGRAFPAMPTRIVKAYFDGYRAKHNVAIMSEAIDAGLVPIGKRFFNQDITSMMESPDLAPGRSWTAKILGAIPGLFDEAAGNAVKVAIDKAGDFWHNTLLWDRIADLQMGLYVNFRGDMIAKGMDAQTASRVAAHMANRYAGALPKEAMSEAATKVSNFLLFSRSFTIGNLGVIKDMLTGLPKDVMAQIERDMGTVDPKAVGYAKSMARRKAIATVGLDLALMHVGNSVLQSAFNVMLGQGGWTQEGHEYMRRFRDLLNEGAVHPLSLLNPFHVAGKLSATAENEPNRSERIMIGNAKDGTAIYARNPVGKIGEEFSGYFGSPIDMMRKKQGTIARPLLQIYSNDAGFGRKVYDPGADTPAKYAGNIWAIVKHIAGSQLPEGQIGAFSDLVKGEGDAKVNALQAFGPFAGVTFSKGAPGGPAVGEMYASKSQHEFKVNQALPDIRRQILRGDIAGAQDRMMDLDIPMGLQRFYIKTTLDPALRMSPRATRDFYLHATPEQRQRFDRARQAPPQ